MQSSGDELKEESLVDRLVQANTERSDRQIDKLTIKVNEVLDCQLTSKVLVVVLTIIRSNEK